MSIAERLIRWREIRSNKLFFVIAKKTGKEWEFCERSALEVRWYLIPPTKELIEKAEKVEREGA